MPAGRPRPPTTTSAGWRRCSPSWTGHADDSFVHISFHGHAPGETNPISSTDAFAHFIDGHGERRQGEVDQQNASLVGAYLTVIG